jgi:hypothetical protein
MTAQQPATVLRPWWRPRVVALGLLVAALAAAVAGGLWPVGWIEPLPWAAAAACAGYAVSGST